MALDVATVVVKADTTDLKKGGAELDKFTQKGAKAEKQTQKIGGAAEKMGKKMGGGSHQLRMASMQLSQVAQQGAVTGNYLSALAVQLPDIGLAFGTIGIAAGVLGGALLPLAGSMLGVSDEGKRLETALDRVSEALSEVDKQSDLAGLSLVELSDRYGTMAVQAREIAEVQREIASIEALAALSDAVGAITDQYGTFINLYDGMGDLVENRMARATRAIQRDLKLTDEAAKSLAGAFLEIETARGPEAQAEALLHASDVLQAFAGEAIKTDEDVRAIYQSLLDAAKAAMQVAGIDMASAFDDAAAAAATFTDELREALRVSGQLSLERATIRAAGDNPDFFDPRGESPGSGRVVRDRPVPPENRSGYKPPSRGRSKKSGGGARVSEAEREAARIYAATRTELEKYTAELEKLNALHDGGFISAETYTRAIDQLDDKYKDAADAAGDFQAANDLLKDGILEFAMEGENAMDSLGQAIKRAAFEALLFNEGPLAGVFGALTGGGKSGGDILGAIFSGFRADGGPVGAGKSYIVGEKGPELFSPSTSGTIIPNDVLSATPSAPTKAGGDQVQRLEMIVHAAEGVTVEKVNSTVDVKIRKATPGIVGQAVKATSDASRYGSKDFAGI